MFSNVLDFREAEWSIYQNVQYFIWSKNSVFNFTTVRYSLHKCSEMILCLKWQFTTHVSPVSCAIEFMEARKTCHRVLRTSIWLIPYSGELCNHKMYHHDYWDIDHPKRVLLHYCNCKWDTCIAPPTRRPRAHHRVNPYPGARRQNETEMFSDHDETSPSIAAVSAPLAACSMLAVQQQKRLCRQFVNVSAARRGCWVR